MLEPPNSCPEMAAQRLGWQCWNIQVLAGGFPELLFLWVTPEIGGWRLSFWSLRSGTAPGTLQEGSFILGMAADFP